MFSQSIYTCVQILNLSSKHEPFKKGAIQGQEVRVGKLVKPTEEKNIYLKNDKQQQ